jgi:probable F420-dependent oxidoreductase
VKVRIGVSLGIDGATDPVMLHDAVVAMEELRFDSLWLAERISTTTPDPVAGLGFAAARTRRLKLGTGVVILPGRNPAIVAKQLATLDRLSGGRLLVTFGLGGEPGERAAFPIPPGARRGDVFDDTLDRVRRLTAGEDVDGVVVRPAPVQTPLEFWVAGSVPEAQRRVGRLADGWLGSFVSPEQAKLAVEAIKAAAAEAGREIEEDHYGLSLAVAPNGLPPELVRSATDRAPGVDLDDIVPASWDAARRLLDRYLDAGLTKFVLRPAGPVPWREFIDNFLPLTAALHN